MTMAVVALVLLFVGAGAQMRPRRTRTQPEHQKEFSTLPDLMREGLHEQFTALSFRIWHDSPLTDKKFDTIAKHADKLHEFAERIPSFKSSYFAGHNEEDRAAVDAKAAAVAGLADLLSRAAKRRDAKKADSLLTEIEATCNACHARFRRELSTQYVEQTQPKN
jgi:cytochrome c553